jgi:DNA-binding response OmpR family regulator
MKILIVEDEPKVASFLKKGLVENNYESDVAYDGPTAIKLLSQYKYDLYVLDVILPGLSGIELCRKIRSTDPAVPILMLTALGTTDDKLLGFDAGADDYLVKPFEFRELLARIKALLRKKNPVTESVNRLSAFGIEIDLDRKNVKREGQTIDLTAKEFALLEYLMRNSGRVLSRNDIAEKVWDASFDFGTNVVDVYVNFLRKKIEKGFEKKLIHTKVGFGYYFGEN